MPLHHRTFWLPKDVRHSGEYQDAWHLDAERQRAAIADGVSSGIFSADWAQRLTRAAVAEPPSLDDPQRLTEWLAAEREAWRAAIDPEQLAWHQKPKLQQGAFSTLLFMYAVPNEAAEGSTDRRFHVAAIGDSCLFHFRDGQLLLAFPIEDSAAFEADPLVLGSVNRKQDHLLAFEQIELDVRPGDTLLLATDAVAAWIVAEREANRTPAIDAWWEMSQEAWRGMIIELREENRIRYDDSTALLLRIERPAAHRSHSLTEGIGRLLRPLSRRGIGL